jgi:hypothetical protein
LVKSKTVVAIAVIIKTSFEEGLLAKFHFDVDKPFGTDILVLIIFNRVRNIVESKISFDVHD